MRSNKRPVVVLVIAIIVGGIIWATALYGRQPKPKSNNNNVEVIEVLPGEGATKITLRNISDKNINGLQVSVGTNSFIVEFLDADETKQKLRPGEIYQEWFPVKFSNDISILAVVFDDNSSSGNALLAQEIFDTRRGVKKQLKQFGEVLKESLNSAHVDEITLDKLSAELDKPVNDDPEDSGGVRMGQRKAKQQIRQQLEELKRKVRKEPSTNIRTGLTNIGLKQTQRQLDLL
ncbi:MAG TPA: hypothetical protein VI306_03665 [Pyrinomonadaceae bacterium]